MEAPTMNETRKWTKPRILGGFVAFGGTSYGAWGAYEFLHYLGGLHPIAAAGIGLGLDLGVIALALMAAEAKRDGRGSDVEITFKWFLAAGSIALGVIFDLTVGAGPAGVAGRIIFPFVAAVIWTLLILGEVQGLSWREKIADRRAWRLAVAFHRADRAMDAVVERGADENAMRRAAKRLARAADRLDFVDPELSRRHSQELRDREIQRAEDGAAMTVARRMGAHRKSQALATDITTTAPIDVGQASVATHAVEEQAVAAITSSPSSDDGPATFPEATTEAAPTTPNEQQAEETTSATTEPVRVPAAAQPVQRVAARGEMPRRTAAAEGSTTTDTGAQKIAKLATAVKILIEKPEIQGDEMAERLTEAGFKSAARTGRRYRDLARKAIHEQSQPEDVLTAEGGHLKVVG